MQGCRQRGGDAGMRRVLFRWFGCPVYSYPAMLYTGIVLGIYVQLYAGKQIGLDTAPILTATLLLLVAALSGARLLHVLPNWRYYRAHPRRILDFASGGASMYGGLLLAVPLSIVTLAALNIPFWTFWDIATFTLLIGMIITRAGCFLNGCCAGRATASEWGMYLPDYRGIWKRRVPTQILEAAWGTVVLVGATLMWRRIPFDGALFLYAVAGYGLGRLVLEPLRDRPDRVAGMRLQSAVSLILVASSVAALTILVVQRS